MSCIAYVCHCQYTKGNLKTDFDFEKNQFVQVPEVQDAGKSDDKFFVFQDTEANDFDFYVFCSTCLIKLIESYNFGNEMQKECFNEIFSFSNKRAGNHILEGEFLFHHWNLCRKRFANILGRVQQDLNTVFHTNI